MRKVGNDIYIQRGETWSLDFQVENNRGDPYMILKEWKHPYLAITVTAARYAQKGDFRRTWWLDLNQRWVEDSMGNMTLEPIKKFVSTEALYIANFTIADILAVYGTENGGNIVLDKNSDFDVTNYLFFTDSNMDNGRVYKYLADYEVTNDTEGSGLVTVETWKDYDFRIIKAFITRDWVEQTYLYDIKVLAGESIEERVYAVLVAQGEEVPDLPWTEDVLQEQINLINDKDVREECQAVYDSGMPLMPDFDTKALILMPAQLIVSANIQGGSRINVR